ncbi:hypothetical protein LXM50_13375 [Microbacterium sp. Au-Mic1]|uniref:hypothetical protein n=1 Tax=Microbacterium sp. Au-Mic1 TaxID=2906457 RepID=UPI001E50DC1A|nr:hypothetical protein [Microbacterium sp. Au-Mic1]MCE4026964.1 hypothetical protein [Microbacterium sp. Au-Mic1]
MPLPFPPGCPPDDADPKPGTYFRLAPKGMAVGDATSEACWRRPYETPKGRLEGQGDTPEAHGLSLFADIEDVRAATRFTPWFRGKSVAEITIGALDGSLRHSPTPQGESHHDWWTKPYDFLPQGVIVEVLEEVA